jgi:hypothetical protein
MVLHKLPNVLVIHLKRFSYGNMFAKITKPVQFGVDLVVQSGQGAKVRYELHGVVVHHGHSTHSGHYIAYVKVSAAWVWDLLHNGCTCVVHRARGVMLYNILTLFSPINCHRVVSVSCRRRTGCGTK